MSAASGRPEPPGRLVDIGGRRLHLVCAGPGSGSGGAGPTVLLEAGAFGFSADWSVVQDKLARQGVRSCAYDRAGLGYSDPGPAPRDGLAVTTDLDKLLAAAGEPGPYVLVGHSMAGLYVPLFARRHPDTTAGVVLVEGATPESSLDGQMKTFAVQFGRLAGLADGVAAVGLLKPFAFMGDAIGLEPQAAAEKRWAFAHAAHNHWAAAEVSQWMNAAQQAHDAGPLDPDLPVAVVTAGHAPAAWDEIRAAPARRSRRGYYENVPAAAHATLLGKRFADHIVTAIDHVRAAAAAEAAPGPGRAGAPQP